MKYFNKKLTEGLSTSEIKFLDHFIDELTEYCYINLDKSADAIYIHPERIKDFLYRYFNNNSPSYIPDTYINCVTSSLNAYTWNEVASPGYGYPYEKCFSGRQMQKINIPEGVHVIPFGAFENCAALEEVYIPNSVYLISDGAFHGCKALKSARLGATIGEDAFSGCASLQSVRLDWGDKIKAGAFYKCTSLTDVTISAPTSAIGAFAFEGCSALRRVYLPKSIKSIGAGAFNDCPQLIVETDGKRVASMCKKMGVKVKLTENLHLNETRRQTAVKSNGVYSVLKDEWIKEPVAEDIPEINEEEFEKLFKEWEDKYFELMSEVKYCETK
jgi:hypothetical protein